MKFSKKIVVAAVLASMSITTVFARGTMNSIDGRSDFATDEVINAANPNPADKDWVNEVKSPVGKTYLYNFSAAKCQSNSYAGKNSPSHEVGFKQVNDLRDPHTFHDPNVMKILVLSVVKDKNYRNLFYRVKTVPDQVIGYININRFAPYDLEDFKKFNDYCIYDASEIKYSVKRQEYVAMVDKLVAEGKAKRVPVGTPTTASQPVKAKPTTAVEENKETSAP